MSDLIVLVCGVLASLAFGVLLAYSVCLGIFRIFQMRASKAELELSLPAVGVGHIVEG